MRENLVRVYGLYSTEPENSSIRYIGQTKYSVARRLRDHIKNSREGNNSHRSNWIRLAYKNGYIIKAVVLKENAVWNETEMRLISEYKNFGYNLVNATDGGEGTINMSPEARKKISQSKMGKKANPIARLHMSQANKGRSTSEEHRKNLSLALKGKGKGRILSEDHKKHLSEALKGRHLCEEHKRKIQLALQGRHLSKEVCEKNRAGHLGKYPSQETRERMRLAQRKRWNKKETI